MPSYPNGRKCAEDAANIYDDLNNPTTGLWPVLQAVCHFANNEQLLSVTYTVLPLKSTAKTNLNKNKYFKTRGAFV